MDVEVRMSQHSLANVLSELVDRLVADDWCRFSTGDGSRHYYEIGFEAAHAGRTGDADFRVLEWPAPNPISPLAEWYSRSQVASKHPDYAQQARRRLESLGVPSAAIDGVEQGDFDFNGWRWNDSATRDQQFEALQFFLQALNIRGQKVSTAEIDHVEQNEVDAGRQKLFLQEVAAKFRRLLDEISAHDPVDCHDPTLEEASKCFLYGFYKATIVLSAEAVDECLKKATDKRDGSYRDRVKTAFCQGKLGKNYKDLGQPTEALFDKRRDVVHNYWRPTEDEAGQILGMAKKVVDHLKAGLR
jgi:hypothetical protein